MWTSTHGNGHGLLDLLVAHQLNVSILIVMNLERRRSLNQDNYNYTGKNIMLHISLIILPQDQQ